MPQDLTDDEEIQKADGDGSAIAGLRAERLDRDVEYPGREWL